MAVGALSKQAVKILSKFLKEGRNPDAAKVAKKALGTTKFTKTHQKIIQDLTGETNTISAKSGFPVGKTGVKNSPFTESHRKSIGAATVKSMLEKGYYPKQVGLPTYENYVTQTSKALGVPYRQAKQDPGVMGSVQLRRGESAFYPGRNTPTEKLFDKYGYTADDFGPIVQGRADLTAAMDDLGIFSLVDKLGITRPGSRVGSIGHSIPMQLIADMVKANPNLSRKQILKMVNNPQFMSPEVNFLNQAKRGIESFLYNPKYADKNLAGVGDILNEAQMTTRVLDPKTLQMITYGIKQGLDPKQLKEYLKRVLKDRPFGISGKTGKISTMPNINYLRQNFAAGGLASMIGRKAIKKIAKKLSEKDLKLLMGSFFKGTKPSTSPKNLREERIKEYLKGKGATKKWQYAKSKIPGPR